MAVGNGFNVTNSYLHQFDDAFQAFLNQGGSRLLGAVTHVPMIGETKTMRQVNVGDAHWITTSGGITEHTAVSHDARELRPRPFACTITLDPIDLVKQGTPDIGLLVREAGNRCGEKIDDIIIAGLGGNARTISRGDVPLPTSQIIRWNSTRYAENQQRTMNSQLIDNGLSSSKIAAAVTKLRAKWNSSPIICVASEHALQTLRSDSRSANIDFNFVQSFAHATNQRFAGVDAFIACQRVDRGTSTIGAASIGSSAAIAAPEVEYAYVFAMDQIRLGISKELTLESGPNPERNFATTMQYTGMYDCIRMFEDSVVKIEVYDSHRTPSVVAAN